MSSKSRNDNELDDAILDVLKAVRRSLTPTQIRHRLTAKSMRPPINSIERRLRAMVISNTVTEAIRGTFSIPKTEGQTEEVDRWVDAETVAESSRQQRQSKPKAVEPPSIAGRWGDFRRMCRYYAECMRLEESSSVHAWGNTHGEKFIWLGPNLTWDILSQGTGCRISIHDTKDLVHQLNQSKGTPVTWVGLPCTLSKGEKADGQTFERVTPVLLQEVRTEVQDAYLLLRPTGPPRINLSWLQDNFKKVAQQQHALELLGLESAEIPHLKNVFQRLNQHYSSHCREPLQWAGFDATTGFNGVEKTGIYNRAILIVQPALKYSNRTYRELITLTDPNQISDERLDQTALKHLFPHDPPDRIQSSSRYRKPNPVRPAESSQDNEPEDTRRVAPIEVESLSSEQAIAALAIARDDLSVIQGPPGTGKSRLVRHILANSAARGRSALFASKNHEAIASVVPPLQAWGKSRPLILNLARRFNNEDDAMNLRESLTEITSDLGDQSNVEKREHCLDQLAAAHDRLARCQRVLISLGNTEQLLSDASEQLEEALTRMPTHWRDAFEKEHVKLEKIARAQDLHQTLLAFKRHSGPLSVLNMWSCWRYRRTLGQSFASLSQALSEITGEQTAFQPPKTPWEAADHIEPWLMLGQAAGARLKEAEARQTLERIPTREALFEEWKEAEANTQAVSIQTIQAVADALGADATDKQRQALMQINAETLNLNGAEATKASQKISKQISKRFPLLIQALPLWSVTNLSVGREIPLESSLFDLLVLDEASQCDIASVVPLLFRCKRAVIVGDPKQLPHVVQLQDAENVRIRARHGLDDIAYANYMWRQSVYGLADYKAEKTCHHFLREHRRCHPDIARYFSSTYYRDQLDPWAEISTFSPVPSGEGPENGIRWTDTPNDAKGAPGGGSISLGQIEAIVQELKRLAGVGYAGSIGVIAPFNAQANRLRDRIMAAFNNAPPDRWSLKVGTADSFQGGERDLVLFSLVGGSEMPRGSHWFYSRENDSGMNRFNVAVSRAKALLHVFGNRDWCKDLPKNKYVHLHNLLESATSERPASKDFREDLVGPVWEPRFAKELQAAGVPFLQQYPVLGAHRPKYYLDFALLSDDFKLAVEVDGEYHRNANGLLRSEDIRRDQALIAAGWQVQRFWVYELRENMAECVQKVQTLWTSKGRTST